MNARIFAGCTASCFVLAATAAVFSTDVPRALAQAQSPLQAQATPPGKPVAWPQDRPSGIPSNRWIPINGRLGIVIVHPRAPTDILPGQALPRGLHGYFAVYHAGRWWRLLASGGSLVPLAELQVAPRDGA